MLLLLFVFALLYAVRTLIPAVLLAFVLAYLLGPLVNWLQRRARLPRWAGALLVFFLLALLISGAAAGLGLGLTGQLGDLVQDLIVLSEQVPQRLQDLASVQLRLGPWVIDFSKVNVDPLLSGLASILQPFLSQTGTLLSSVVTATASALGGVALVVFVGFYTLVDLEGAEERLALLAPPAYQPDMRRLLTESMQVWRAFLRGQFLLGLALGVVTGVILAILGVRFALVLGLLAGLLGVVPFFGPFVAGAVAVIVAFFQGSNWLGLHPLGYAAVVLVAYLIIQQIEHGVLVPHIIGYSLNMRPLTVLLAALAGAAIGGVLGVLLAQPIFATLRIWVNYAYRKVADMDPWPPKEPPLEADAAQPSGAAPVADSASLEEEEVHDGA